MLLETRRRFSVDDYYAMAAVGILRPGDRVELIEGAVVEMSPIGPRHAGAVNACANLLMQRLGARVIVAVQNPLRLAQDTELQPDVAVLRSRARHYADRHPTPRDVHWVVEVAESSLRSDREIKLPLYARSGIPEVWIVDVPAQRIEIHARPVDGRYRTRRRCALGDTLHPAAFPETGLSAASLLGHATDSSEPDGQG